MAKIKEIDIEIDEISGEIKMETVQGTSGVECTEVLNKLEALLNTKTLSVIDKPEKLSKQATSSKQKQDIKKW